MTDEAPPLLEAYWSIALKAAGAAEAAVGDFTHQQILS